MQPFEQVQQAIRQVIVGRLNPTAP
jgi:hypothetical protein